jgi:hypothetical protein
MYVTLMVGFRIGAFKDDTEPELDALMWEGAQSLLRHLEDGKFDDDNMLEILSLWHGKKDPQAAWEGFADKLEPRLRLQAAILFGSRFLQNKQPQHARPFLEEALRLAKPGSVEQRMARQRLDRNKK